MRVFSVNFYFVWDKCQGVQLSDYMADACLIFLKNYQTVSRIKIPKATYARSSFSTFLLTFGVVTIFNYFDVFTVISHCGFNIYSPNGLRCWTLFLLLIIMYIFSLVKCLFISLPVFLLDYYFSCWDLDFFIYSGY